MERLNVSRSDMRVLFEDAWDHRCLGQREERKSVGCSGPHRQGKGSKKNRRQPGRDQLGGRQIQRDVKEDLVRAIGPEYSARLSSSEKLATLWFETLLDEELDLYERAAGLAHHIISETFSEKDASHRK